MSNQGLLIAETTSGFTPPPREPLTQDWAGDPARMFRALGDPVSA